MNLRWFCHHSIRCGRDHLVCAHCVGEEGPKWGPYSEAEARTPSYSLTTQVWSLDQWRHVTWELTEKQNLRLHSLPPELESVL